MATITPAVLDLADIQGNILRPYRCQATTYVFLTVVDPALARLWLADLQPLVTSAAQPPRPVAVNLAVTFAGLARLGVPPHKLARLPRAFREGMRARAAGLGDLMTTSNGEPAPDGWHEPFGPASALHLMLMVSGSPDEVRDRVAELQQDFWQSGVTEPEPSLATGVQQLDQPIEAARLGASIEHFGFRDGLSQPAIEGVHEQAVAGSGRLDADGRWRPLKAGEFIIGMRGEDGVAVEDIPSLTRNGSYLVLRKLEQDVPAFLAMVDRAARHTRMSDEQVKALLMGRWPDGTPLLGHATDPDPRLVRDPYRRNDFDFREDPTGVGCPVGSHVRRANPRGSLGFDTGLEHRRRIIRRGMTYGPPYTPATAEEERGLVFVCYQADIAGQFELVQAQWLSDGNVFALGTDRDPVVAEPEGGSKVMRLAAGTAPLVEGQRAEGERAEGERAEGECVASASRPVMLDTEERSVIVRGGEYFLVPSLSAIRRLAELDVDEAAVAP